MNIQEYTLPEFVFIDGNSHEGNTLEGRTVIQHIRSYSIIEVISLDDIITESFKSKTYKFQYQNIFGVVEHFMFAIHFTLAEDNELETIFEKSKEWFLNYVKWEDENIERGSKSLHN